MFSLQCLSKVILRLESARRKKESFTIVREDRDYKPIQGTKAFIPYESLMFLKLNIQDQKSLRELEKAREEYEKARAELEKQKAIGGLASAISGQHVR